MPARLPDGSRLRFGFVALLALGCAVLLRASASTEVTESTLTVEERRPELESS